jgi:hypothetical protein
MNLKPLLIHKLLDCFERKYNLRRVQGSYCCNVAANLRPARLVAYNPPYWHEGIGIRLTRKVNET